MYSDIGVVLCSCDEGINNFIDTDTANSFPAKVIKINYPCFGTGLAHLKTFILENRIKKIIIGGCNPKTHISIFKKSLDLKPNCIEMINLKQGYSNIIELFTSSIKNLSHIEPKEILNIKPIKTVTIIGNDIGALITAKNLASKNIKTILITNYENLIDEVKSNPDIEFFFNPQGWFDLNVKGHIGNYEVTLKTNEIPKIFKTGAFIITTKDTAIGEKLKLKQDENGYFIETKHRLKPLRYLPYGVFVTGEAYKTEDVIEHAYNTASKVFNLVNSQHLLLEPVWVNINKDICRGCGKCAQICEFNAIDMINLDNGLKQAVLNQTRCTGCGVCTTICPSGANYG